MAWGSNNTDVLSMRADLMKSLRSEFQKQEQRDKKSIELSTQTIMYLKKLNSASSGLDVNILSKLTDEVQDYTEMDEKYSAITAKWQKKSLQVFEDILEALKTCNCGKNASSSSSSGGLKDLLEIAGVAAAAYLAEKAFKEIPKAVESVEKGFKELESGVKDVTKALETKVQSILKGIEGVVGKDYKAAKTAVSSGIGKVKKFGSTVLGDVEHAGSDAWNGFKNTLSGGANPQTPRYSRFPGIAAAQKNGTYSSAPSGWETPLAVGGLGAAALFGLGGPDEILGGAIGAGALAAPAFASPSSSNLDSLFHRTSDDTYSTNATPGKIGTLYVDNLVANSSFGGSSSSNGTNGIIDTAYTTGGSVNPWAQLYKSLGLTGSAPNSTGASSISTGTNIGANSASTFQAINAVANGNSNAANLLTSFAGMESNFNPNAGNSTSSAQGAFQITSGTAADWIKKYGQKLGITSQNYNPNNPSQQAALVNAWSADQQSYNSKNGISNSALNLYEEYFSGNSALSTANPNAIAANVVGAAAAAANPDVFYNSDDSPRTVAQVDSYFQNRLNNVASSSAMASSSYGRSKATPSGTNYTPSPTAGTTSPVTGATNVSYTSQIGGGITNSTPTLDDIPMHLMDHSIRAANTAVSI